MPLPTGGPVITGVPPEQWAEILKALQQFGVTVWDLAQQGITTWEGAGGLKEYLINNGWEQIEFWELKTQWVHTGAGNATESNALVQYLANEITLAGAAGSQYVKHFSFGGSTMGKLKKGVVFGSIFALLVSSLDPSFITDALKGRLNEVIDRFADDNDDVPVIVGEDGKTYYHEDMINALRQALIDEGAYSTGEPQPEEIPEGLTSFTIDSGMTLEQICDYIASLSSTTANNLFTRYNIAPETFAPFARSEFERRFPSVDFDSCAFVATTYQTQVNVLAIEYGTYSVERYFTGSNTYYDTIQTYSINGAGMHALSFTGNENGLRVRVQMSVASNQTFPLNRAIAYYRASSSSSFNMSSISWLKNPTTDAFEGYAINGVGTTMKPAVEGITVESDLIDRGIGDISTALEDVFPSYATDKITTINPSDEDITGHEDWYPISTADSDVWTDGITEQQSETATDGEVTPDIQTQLADAIKQILEDYYRDPTDPNIINYPEISAGDSGDTPPENPPLIPPSDVTGSNGLWSIYNPSLQNVNDFGAWLWSDSLADQFKRIFNSPIDGVIGFHMLYCTPSTGTAKPIKCGFLQSPVSAPVVTNPYVEIDCGTVSINEYYRNAMDYDNTRISVYLPFIGIVPLDTNIVMGSDINITYRVDVLTGTCLAQIKVIKENSDAVMYAFDGNCAVQIPLTATTYTGMIGALLGGISAGASIMTGNMVQAIGSGVRALASGMTGLSGAKQSGTFGANVGALGIRIPYVIITHPVSAMPGQFNKLEGIPSNNVVVLGSLSGYTRVRSVHLENIGNATQEELQMIQEQLESGVII